MRSLFVIIFINVALLASGQPKTYLGINTGPAWDITRVQDSVGVFDQSLARGRISGITLSQDIVTNLFLSTGISIHENRSGINIKDQRRYQPEYPTFNTIYIPIRLGLRIPFKDQPFSITPHVGYQFGIVTGDASTWSINSSINNAMNQRISYEIQSKTPSFSRTKQLEAGMSLGYRFSNNYQLSISLEYYNGLSESILSEIIYSDGNGNTNEATYNSDGSRMEAMFSIQVPLSNLWENRDIRLHKNIERSSIRSNGTRTQNQVYFGLHAASLYRTFTSTNPAIGPRSRNNFNPFLFANLNTGIHAGILFENNFGIDVGGAYQRSSTAITLSYDQDNEVVIKSKAPFFLEVPLNVRYFYQVYRTDFRLVPAIGISLLTHLSNGTYEGGAGEFTWNSTNTSSSETYDYSGTRTTQFGATAQLSMALEYPLPFNFPLNLYTELAYKFGYRMIDQVTVNASPDNNGISNLTYDGSGLQVSVGARIPFIPGGKRCGTEQRKRAEDAINRAIAPY